MKNRWQINEWEFNRCPMSYVEQDYFWYIRAYNFYEKGILPGAGGWMNQTKKFIDAMAFMGSLINEHQQQEMKKNAKK